MESTIIAKVAQLFLQPRARLRIKHCQLLLIADLSKSANLATGVRGGAPWCPSVPSFALSRWARCRCVWLGSVSPRVARIGANHGEVGGEMGYLMRGSRMASFSGFLGHCRILWSLVVLSIYSR